MKAILHTVASYGSGIAFGLLAFFALISFLGGLFVALNLMHKMSLDSPSKEPIETCNCKCCQQ